MVLELIRRTMRLYERLGLQRAPELDLQLVPDATIKGYHLDLQKTAP